VARVPEQVGVELADAGALSSMNLFYFHNEKGGVSMEIVDKITMVHLVVRDMDAAKAFYTDVLGFEATGDTKWDGRSVFVVPPGDGTYVALNTMSDEIKPGIGKMFLSTPDVEAAYKEIKAKGVKPNSEIMPYPPGGRFFSVNDPDGNLLFILQ
jgi:predicted enzyme related to lactoylglutathione lyase